MSKQAAIYARYSSTMQRAKSIADQVELCRAYAKRQGIEVVRVYHDEAKSGASMVPRVGFQAMMRDATAKKFNLIVTEDVDRAFRDQADFHATRKKIAFLGIALHTPHAGELSAIEGSMRAMMGEFFLDDLRRKVHRGLSGVIRDGRNAGGKAYGYRPIPGKPGELEIVPEEAIIINRIFDRYLSGDTPRVIAAALNNDGVPPPRGVYWRASTINGNKTRGHGILQNPLYVGRLVWNRVRMARNPATGRRVSRPNDPSEWQYADVPALAIVKVKIFDAVQRQKAARSHLIPAMQRSPKRILSGILKCSVCGSGLSIKDRYKGQLRIVCTQSREAGTCVNKQPYNLQAIECAAVEGLRERLTNKNALFVYAREYNQERCRLSANAGARRAKLEKNLATAEQALQRGVKAILNGTMAESEAKEEMERLRTERDQARKAIDAGPEKPNVIQLHPATIDRFRKDLERLDVRLQQEFDANDSEVVGAFRDLVHRVIVYPPKNGNAPDIVVQGRLDVLTKGGRLVAEEGLEPPTQGL